MGEFVDVNSFTQHGLGAKSDPLTAPESTSGVAGPPEQVVRADAGPLARDRSAPSQSASSVDQFRAFVGRLPSDTREMDLVDFFGEPGLKSVHLVRDRRTGHFKRYAYVEFDSMEGLRRALEMTGSAIRGGKKHVFVDVARDPAVKRGQGGRRRGGRRGRGQGHGRSFFRPTRYRQHSPVSEKDKVDPFAGSRPREVVLAERKAKREERQRLWAEKNQQDVSGEDAKAPYRRRKFSGFRGRARGKGRKQSHGTPVMPVKYSGTNTFSIQDSNPFAPLRDL